MSLRLEVAVVVDPSKPYDRSIVRGVASYVKVNELDWSLYVEVDPITRLPDLSNWAGHGILANFDNERVATAIERVDVPVVAVGGGYGYYNPSSRIPYIRTDNRAIARMAADHLLALGLTEFAFCSERANRFNGWAKERGVAFRHAIEAAGYECRIHVGRFHPARNWRKSQEELARWLLRIPTPIGILASNDSRARQLLEVCRQQGIRVPEELAIVGVDNDDIMCDLSKPPLTSIEQGARRIGFEAARQLDGMMQGEKSPEMLKSIPPERLVARQSTDMLAVADPELSEAVRFIRHNACKPIEVKDVLDHVRLSRSTLEGRMLAVLGHTIHSEIRRVRIARATELLTTTNLSIKQIVRAVGASSVQYFTAMMRNVTGKTPGAIRRESLKGQDF